MSTKSEYYKFAEDGRIIEAAKAEAERFAAEEVQFQLGHVPTEQPHPYTLNFSSEVGADPAAGCRRLLQVDADMPPIVRRTFLTAGFQNLVDGMKTAVSEKRRICFSGCGSTGRLSMILEQMWRQYWEESAPEQLLKNARAGRKQMADLACSIMTGGDRALIRSVENFEDYTAFGARQTADLNLGGGDIFVAISEGGETSSVIGTAEEALRRGCGVSFVFNNPAGLLCSTVERSERLINNPSVNVIDLYTGSMSLTGSTRMQATSIEMMVVGAAMEEAFLDFEGRETDMQMRTDKANSFASLISSLGDLRNSEVLGELAALEAGIYEAGARVTYLADDFLLDIFSDTTERSPTFMLPPFRPSDDTEAAVSWAFAKDPTRPSSEAWKAMLRRSPRGIDWDSEDYRAMGAPQKLVDSPPSLGQPEIAR